MQSELLNDATAPRTETPAETSLSIATKKEAKPSASGENGSQLQSSTVPGALHSSDDLSAWVNNTFVALEQSIERVFVTSGIGTNASGIEKTIDDIQNTTSEIGKAIDELKSRLVRLEEERH